MRAKLMLTLENSPVLCAYGIVKYGNQLGLVVARLDACICLLYTTFHKPCFSAVQLNTVDHTYR